jgi:hypothetical protein
MGMNGVSLGIVKVAILAPIAIPELNSSFTLKYTNQQSAMTYRLQATAQEECSVLLPTMNVS